MKSKDIFRRIFYFVIQPFVKVIAWVVFRIKMHGKDKIKGQYFVLSNHSSLIDSVLVSSMFQDPIYFAAASLLIKTRFWGKFLKFLTGIIPIDKSGFDIKALRAILRAKAEGKTIGLFPEGNNTINGAPLYFGRGIAKLAKQLKLPIALCNIYGGYLTHPKWAAHRRKGEVTGKVVKILSQEEVEAMSIDELYAVIRTSLYVDAFEVQEQEEKTYPHKKLSKGIESLLFLCSECSGFCTFASYDDYFECKSCGVKMRYNEKGYIEGSRFDNTRDWDSWQIDEVYKKVKECKDNEAIYTVSGYEVIDHSGSVKKTITEGDFVLYKDRIEVGDCIIKIEEIEGTALHIINCVLITTVNRVNYLLLQKNPYKPGIFLWYAIDALRGVESQNKPSLRLE